MGESGRNYLSGSIMLSDDRKRTTPCKYTVKSIAGEGGSVVCYDVVTETAEGLKETGKLKEFYPMKSADGDDWYYSMERLPNGQLVPGTGTIRKFDDMVKEFVGKYKLLGSVIDKDRKNEILKNFIQYGRILYGVNDNSGFHWFKKPDIMEKRNPTVYVFSPGFCGEQFDRFISDIREEKEISRPEEKLKNILITVKTLADCISSLHEAGIMHLDIKPSNFMVQYGSESRIRPESVSLFDISTICSIEDENIRMCGTEGFCAPDKQPSNKADVFSIGATLFNALVYDDDIPNGIYSREFYGNFRMILAESKLFKCSEANSDHTLISILSRALEKSLNPDPRKRCSCSELRKNLDEAVNRLTKKLLVESNRSHEGTSDSAVVIQKLLYDHPLYGDFSCESSSVEKKNINVMLLGAGAHARRFLDTALESGQMLGSKIKITAFSAEPEEDFEHYIGFRPAMREFVNINGSLDENEEAAYGTLDFRHVDIFGGMLGFGLSKNSDVELVKNIIKEANENGKPFSYVFVALGDDKRNYQIAKICTEELKKESEIFCPVFYVSEDYIESKAKREKKSPAPVMVNEPVDIDSENQVLGEMAFNTHLSWRNSFINVLGERKEFFGNNSIKARNNRISSLAFALSIKYKLHSINIDCQNPVEAASAFSKQILEVMDTDPEARRKFEEMVELEHRRWVINRASNGWTAPRDENGKLRLEDCLLRGSVRDDSEKLHPCMVRSSVASPLSKYTKKQWDEEKISSGLDELDRMSVELHRVFKKSADESGGISCCKNELNAIESVIPYNNDKVKRAFKEFKFALKNVFGGIKSFSEQYNYYEELFLNSLEDLSKQGKEEIVEKLASIKRKVFPVIEYNLYRNYKKYDEVLIKKIPFILTYRYNSSLAVVFDDGKYQNGKNEPTFASVASATVLNPQKITYFYCFDKDSEADLFEKKVGSLLNYAEERKICSEITMTVICTDDVSAKNKTAVEKALAELEAKPDTSVPNGKNLLKEFFIVDAKDNTDVCQKICSYLDEDKPDLFDGTVPLFPSAYENSAFLRKFAELGIPYFEFDWRSKKFINLSDCENLRYVEDSSFIRIKDMFALMNAEDTEFNIPDLSEDYEKLWKIYTGGAFKDGTLDKFKFGYSVGNWNKICNLLSKYENDRKHLAEFDISENPKRGANFVSLTFLLPEYAYTTVNKLVGKLIEYGIVGKESRLSGHNSESFELFLKADSLYKDQINILFSDHIKFLPYYGLNARRQDSFNKELVFVDYNELEVKDFNLPPKKENQDRNFLYELLVKLEKEKFIHCLVKKSEEIVSFKYSSPTYKRILTCAGEILEVHTYFELLKEGIFDDIATGYKFRWADEKVKNELDIVATKRFNSCIIECKAVENLTLDYYHKLHSLSTQFGINTKTILLGNIYKSCTEFEKKNEIQKSRGNQLGIITISEGEEIIKIGETLKKIIEKQY